jgi:hypothetical protein
MKIACYGNMNNNSSAIVRYLIDAGYDTELLEFEGEFEHFKPEADCFNPSSLGFIKKISWGSGPSRFKIHSRDSIKKIVKGYDFNIGCGAAPAYFNKAGFKLDVFIPYGSDIYSIPFFTFSLSRYRKFFADYYYALSQRKGIREAKNIILDVSNDKFENYLKKIEPGGKRHFSNIPFLYLPEYSPVNIEKYSKDSGLFSRVKRETADADFSIVMHYGHCWKKPLTSLHNKGNDSVLMGFKKLVSRYPAKKIKLFTFEYGPEIAESKKLVHELGLEENVIWLPISYRKEIMMMLSLMDLGMGEIGNSWFSYGTVYECIASRLPVIMNRNDALYSSQYPEMYPVLHAQNEEEVFHQMDWAFSNQAEARQMGKESHIWFKKYAIDRPLKIIIDIIKANTKKFTDTNPVKSEFISV